ncbi:preprotein translocase subunit YajC [Nesterenkonia flava]|uniref:Preprotein translocase subunit YajC n=1 Tax=Nesterenkonia flava TaxID=469799 RepID=A0ABU1FW49_9MICC|nr:preprotein translocase subunit YajC [Nesterenkonia flava]MDR5712838.1 preprotein translocase subunit YajC [Nesterenkonia flava]
MNASTLFPLLAAPNPLGDPLLLILFGILVLFMVLTFRRGKKMRDEQNNARAGAVIGAEVVTAGGLVGTVVGRDEERQRITLEFSTGDRADFLIGAVQQIIQPAAGATDADETN